MLQNIERRIAPWRHFDRRLQVGCPVQLNSKPSRSASSSPITNAEILPVSSKGLIGDQAVRIRQHRRRERVRKDHLSAHPRWPDTALVRRVAHRRTEVPLRITHPDSCFRTIRCRPARRHGEVLFGFLQDQAAPPRGSRRPGTNPAATTTHHRRRRLQAARSEHRGAIPRYAWGSEAVREEWRPRPRRSWSPTSAPGSEAFVFCTTPATEAVIQLLAREAKIDATTRAACTTYYGPDAVPVEKDGKPDRSATR